ncbi:hypothetical protein F4777DRAFT_174227 [Nemania sp. FL0916]|nr:hypothetical protein F4777DRAFT_174227 [Nemania sp. FL0916]
MACCTRGTCHLTVLLSLTKAAKPTIPDSSYQTIHHIAFFAQKCEDTRLPRMHASHHSFIPGIGGSVKQGRFAGEWRLLSVCLSITDFVNLPSHSRPWQYPSGHSDGLLIGREKTKGKVVRKKTSTSPALKFATRSISEEITRGS